MKKRKNKGSKERISNNIDLLKKIVAILKYQPGGLWIREIARQTSSHPESVRRIISKYPQIFEEYADLTQYGINLKFVRLRKDYQKEYAKIIKDYVDKEIHKS